MTQTPESQQQYGSILTILGENAEQNGKLLNKQITFTHMAIGDANDEYVQPDRKQTGLVNELARIPINSVDVLQPTPDSVPMLKVEAILPDDVNDLVIREFAAVATFDGKTYFHAIGNNARIYVPPPVNNGNVSTPVTLEMIFVITSAEPIVEIDPHVVTASRAYVNEKTGDSVSQSLGSIVYPVEIIKHANIGDSIPAMTQSLRLLKDIGVVGVFKLYSSPASGTLDVIDFASSTVIVGGKKHYIVEASLDPLNPRSWGIKANGKNDDWQPWMNFYSWYYTQISVDSSGGGTPTWTAPKIKDVGGITLLSKPLVYASGYINADFGRTRFKRHSSWAEPVGTFLLQFTQIYQGDMGGICNRDESYFADFRNNNLDETVFRLTGIQSKRGDWVYKFNLKSAIVYLDDYKFSDSPTPVHIERCDRFYLGKGWTTQGALDEDHRCTFQIDSAVFIACEGSLGVPKPHSGKEVAWFGCGKAGAHSKGAIDISKFRAGGEPGSCTLVNSWIEADTTYPVVPSFITIENNDLYSTDRAGDTQTSCILRLFKLPNSIRFNNNTGMPDTGRMIEWGKGVDQVQELNVLKFTSAKSFVQTGNVTGGLFNRFAPANIRDLFMSGAKVPMTYMVGTPGEIVVDTTIVPGNGKYSLEFQANGNGKAGTQYLSAHSSFIMQKVGNVIGTGVVRRLEEFNVFSAAGGASFNKSFTVTPYFLDEGEQVPEVSVNNTSATLRLRISGFDEDHEGEGFKGFIKTELYENNL